MKLYRYELDVGKVLIGEFATSDDAIVHIRHSHPSTKVFSVIATNDDESLDETLWVMEFAHDTQQR